MIGGCSWAGVGSSPQARGAQDDLQGALQGARLIPAGAGSTVAPTGRASPPQAHPRRRGEHAPGVASTITVGGSSPQARGALHVPFVRDLQGGAHPRRRGEHGWTSAWIAMISGSSPQARGAQVWEQPGVGVVGLIPAGAGSTARTWACSTRRTAHPRRRGEHAVDSYFIDIDRGSSPQARGARSSNPRWTPVDRLIPAGAGSTSPPGERSRPRTAHPRRRGEHRDVPESVPDKQGSSPQARGAPPEVRAEAGARGLIPAGAGSTGQSMSTPNAGGAHPRRRGEHTRTLQH